MYRTDLSAVLKKHKSLMLFPSLTCLLKRNQDNITPEVIYVSLNANLLDKLFNTWAANLKNQLLTVHWDLQIILSSLMMLDHDSWAVSYSECPSAETQMLWCDRCYVLRDEHRSCEITTVTFEWQLSVLFLLIKQPLLCRRLGDSGWHCLGLSVWLIFVLMNI